MPDGNEALLEAKNAAARLAAAVNEALELDAMPQRVIVLPPIGPTGGASRLGCGAVGPGCDPDPARRAGSASLGDLVDALQRAIALLHLLDRGLAGPEVPPEVIQGIREITSPGR